MDGEAKVNETRDLDVAVHARLFGHQTVGRETAIYVEGTWSVHPGSDPAGWMCPSGTHPLYVAHCYCDAYADTPVDDSLVPRVFGHTAYCLDVVPEYAASWAGAALVIEEMNRRGYEADIQVRDGTYHVTFGLQRDDYSSHSVCEFSIGESACRAALAAVAGASTGG